jgi:hypothetical protein
MNITNIFYFDNILSSNYQLLFSYFLWEFMGKLEYLGLTKIIIEFS